MVKDRFQEFAKAREEYQSRPIQMQQIDVPNDFFGVVEGIDDCLKQFHQLVSALDLHHRDYMATSHNQPEYTQERGMIDHTNSIIRGLMKRIRREIEAIPQGPQATQIERLQKERLVRSFKDMIQRYQMVQQQFKDKCQSRVKRQYKIVNPNASEEELDQLEDREGAKLFTEEILRLAHGRNAKEALKQAKSEHEDMVQLEASITELHQLFMDMSTLVEEQGHIVDSVESYLEEGAAQIETGVGELEKGVRIARRSRGRRYLLCLCTLILFLVVAAILYVYVKPLLSAAASNAGLAAAAA
jgi:syntaxin 1B/2/3